MYVGIPLLDFLFVLDLLSTQGRPFACSRTAVLVLPMPKAVSFLEEELAFSEMLRLRFVVDTVADISLSSSPTDALLRPTVSTVE